MAFLETPSRRRSAQEKEAGSQHRTVFVTFFPSCANVHLTKDVGMIPYVMQKYLGYRSYVICYKNEAYPSLPTEVPGLQLVFMRQKAARFFRRTVDSATETYRPLLGVLRSLPILIDALPLTVRLGKQIDVLHLFHLKFESIIMALIYRLVNRRGILYLKLDVGRDMGATYYRDRFWSITSPLLYLIFRLVSFDIISAETREQYSYMIRKHPLLSKFADRLLYLPNGVDVTRLSRFARDFDHKENTILHVGRIGAMQKRSHIVLESFARLSSHFPKWRLLLIGTLETSFEPWFERFLHANSSVRPKVVYVGPIYANREKLYEHYSKAKILAFPSIWESFGFVILEAGCLGDAIVGIDIPPVRDVTNNGEFGYLCPTDDAECFAKTLRHALSNPSELARKSESVARHIACNFDWKQICAGLHDKIVEKRRNRSDSQW